MNAYPLRGAAVLALICLVPRASAVPVTQTTILTGSATGSNQLVTVSGNWIFNGYNLAEPLGAVVVTAQMTATVNYFDTNPFASPITTTPNAFFNGWIAIFDGANLTHLSPTFSASDSKPAVTYGQGQTVGFTSVLSQSYTVAFNTPEALAAFSDGATHRIAINASGIGLPSGFGGSAMNVSTVLSVAYAYGVPDSGTTWAMFGACLMGMGAAWRHRRMNRSLPTL